MERQRLDHFFAGSPKPLRLAFVGPVISAMGAALGFNIGHGPGKPLAYVALGFGVLGVAVGVGWDWHTFFTPSGGR